MKTSTRRLAIFLAILVGFTGIYWHQQSDEKKNPSMVNGPQLTFLGQTYEIKQHQDKSAIEYLFQGGKQISGGYHTHQVLGGQVWGILGAVSEVVIDKNGVVMPLGGMYKHEQEEFVQKQEVLGFLGTGFGFETHGAIQHLTLFRERVDGGYHRHYVQDGKVWGQIGSIREVVVETDRSIYKDGGAKKIN